MSDVLSIKSLDYLVTVNNNEVEVGCQVIKGKDALKLAEFLESHRKQLETVSLELGKWYEVLGFAKRMFIGRPDGSLIDLPNYFAIGADYKIKHTAPTLEELKKFYKL